MAPSKVFSVAGVLLAMGSATLASAQGEPTYKVTLGDEGQCLPDVDAAREAAGLAKFIQPTSAESTKRLPLATMNTAWDPLCKDLLNPTGSKSMSEEAIEDFEEGTYAFEILTSSDVDCAATVSQWKGAFKNFNGLPPAPTENTSVYNDKRNVSFIALYNPSSGATADCRLATCTEIPAQAKSDAGVGDSNRQAFIFICMTTPDLLKEQRAPFTQQEWDRISSAITGSGAVALPSFIVVAMAALSIALL